MKDCCTESMKRYIKKHRDVATCDRCGGLTRSFHWSFYTFVPFTVAMLFLDSRWLLERGFNGQIVANILVPLYFGMVYYSMPDARLKKIMLLTIPVSGLGEIILSQGMELWIYKGGSVPFYIPFGHAIVVGTGFQLLWRDAIHVNASVIIKRFLIGYAVLFMAAYWVVEDSLTMVLGLMYFIGVYAMSQRVIYMFMPLFVLFVEFTGTAFGCWAWPSQPFGFLTTTNPPVGSIMFYVYLDMIVIFFVTYWATASERSIKPLT